MSIELLTNRRNFLLGASAFSLAGCVLPEGGADGSSTLKMGVLSDIHITDWASGEIFRKALRYFRAAGVDAVMIVGDMTDHALLVQLENVARSWEEVFPDDRGLGGRHVEKLFVYGNHDVEGLDYRDEEMDKAFLVHHLTYEEAADVTISKIGLTACWERCFHEPYEPIWHKVVKGYHFIGAQWDQWDGVHGIEEWFRNNIGSIDTTRPFFYLQHATPRGTIYGEDSWGDDSGQVTRALEAYPNAAAFSGHSHRPLTDERSYWRGEFTSIGTCSLSYVSLPGGREECPNYRKNLDCRHGQIVTVYPDRLEIERRDFMLDESLGERLVIAMPVRASTFSVRAVADREFPAYPAGAALSAQRTDRGLELTFPGAFANPTARPFEYEVRMAFEKKDPEGKLVMVGTPTKRWFQPDAAFSRARAASASVVLTWPAAEIPPEATQVTCAVVALNSYGGRGGKIRAVINL